MRLYRAIKKTDGKTQARGFWKDPETGKVFYDYIKTETVQDLSRDNLDRLAGSELALFLAGDVLAFVYTVKGSKVEKLSNRQTLTVKGKQSLKAYIKLYLDLFGGVTVFKTSEGYILESWTA